MPNTVASGHLQPSDFHAFVEGQLTFRRKREVEAHLDGCPDCVETLAAIVRSERPASREEQSLLAQTPEPGEDELASKLRPAIAASASRGSSAFEWRPIAVAAALLVAFGTTGWYGFRELWLPAESRRVASETLRAIVDLRQGTGRIPLRYITEFERASVTRSGFDDADPAEADLLANLRAVVARAPEKESLLTLGLLLLDDGELDEAESLFTRVLEADPRSVDALNGVAVLRYEKAQRQSDESYGLLQRGLATLRQAQQSSPEDLRVLYNFGKFYEALEMPQAAAQAWTRYLEKDRASEWAEEAAFQLAQLLPR
jgi:tetratricopeptide (TPR) repeat protein